MERLIKNLTEKILRAHNKGYTDLRTWTKEDILRWLFAPSVGGKTIFAHACDEVGIEIDEALQYVPGIYAYLWDFVVGGYTKEDR